MEPNLGFFWEVDLSSHKVELLYGKDTGIANAAACINFTERFYFYSQSYNSYCNKIFQSDWSAYQSASALIAGKLFASREIMLNRKVQGELPCWLLFIVYPFPELKSKKLF